MIQIKNVTKRYGSTTVLDDVSLVVHRGGVVALIGPNGAGKSTLISAIGRLIKIDGGSVSVDGLDVGFVDSAEIARRLAVLRQDNYMPVRLSVRELVEFGRFPHAGTKLEDRDHERVSWALQSLELESFAERRLDELSGGQRQRAFIAMVMCQDTDYIVLDEPLNNLDLRHGVQTMDLIRSLADDFGKTIIVVLHDINVAGGYADRVIAMVDGRVVADGPPDEVITAANIEQIYGIKVPVRTVGGLPVVMSFRPAGHGV